MDLIDKKILCELDLNCRQTYSQIGRKLRVGRNVVSYRIDNLKQQGVIKKYIASLNLGSLGYRTYKIYLRTKDEKIIGKIVEDKRAIHVLRTFGAFDFSVTVAVRDIRELDDFLMGLKSFITDYDISSVVYSRVFKLSKLLLDQKSEIKFEKYSGEDSQVELNEKEKKILHELAQNANLPIVDLAAKTRLSLDSVKYTLKHLRAVNSFRVLLDFQKLGYYHYVLLVKMRQASSSQENELVAWCNSKKSVLYVTKRIGKYDFEINAALGDIKDFSQFVSELKSRFKFIDSYDIIVNSEILKLNYVPF